MRGRKPIPTHLKILRGNPGKRRLNEREPKSNDPLPECPEHLTSEQRAAWNTFAQSLRSAKIATGLDAAALELLASAYARYLDAASRVAQAGAVWVAKSDADLPTFAYSPYYNVMNREWKKVAEMLREFGMTPSSRTRISAGPADDAIDEFEKFRRRGKRE
jgi:P27 family predicted phage terminase small subunit